MAKYVQGKDGKFAGSIGDGKNKVPTTPPVKPTPSTAGPVSQRPHIVELLAQLANSATKPTPLPAHGKHVRFTQDATGQVNAAFIKDGITITRKVVTNRELDELNGIVDLSNLEQPVDVELGKFTEDLDNNGGDLSSTNFESHLESLSKLGNH